MWVSAMLAYEIDEPTEFCKRFSELKENEFYKSQGDTNMLMYQSEKSSKMSTYLYAFIAGPY